MAAKKAMTPEQIRKFILDAHSAADGEYGNYDSYAPSMQDAWDELLAKLGLADKWETFIDTDENGYGVGVGVRMRSPVEVRITDPCSWEDPKLEPDAIDESVDFWVQFAKTGKPE